MASKKQAAGHPAAPGQGGVVPSFVNLLTTTAMLTGPLLLPTIWGLFSRKVGLRTAWLVTLVSAAAGMVVKFGLG